MSVCASKYGLIRRSLTQSVLDLFQLLSVQEPWIGATCSRLRLLLWSRFRYKGGCRPQIQMQVRVGRLVISADTSASVWSTYKMPSMSQGCHRKLRWRDNNNYFRGAIVFIVISQANDRGGYDYIAQLCTTILQFTEPQTEGMFVQFSYKGFDRVSSLYLIFRTRPLYGSQFCDPFACLVRLAQDLDF